MTGVPTTRETTIAQTGNESLPGAGMPQGLSEAEARERLATGQGSAVAFASSRSYRQILKDNAFNPINVTIFVIGAALLLMDLVLDSLLTVGVVMLNVVVAVFQEGRAKRQLDRIALLTRPKSAVIRDGRERPIDLDEIVVGDVLIIRAGDQIVADGRIVGDRRTIVDESLLTGESEPVEKQPGDPVASGSFCVSGMATYEAEVVGEQSQVNRMTAGARAFRQIKTPVQRAIELILRVMVLLILAILGPVAIDLAIHALSLVADVVRAPFADVLHRAYQNYSVEGTVRSIAVVVGLVPQGMALMLTVAYALAAVRLAGRGALMQQTNAVESLSHVDVLCLDKTGTLTTNRLIFDGLHPLAATEVELDGALGDFAASATVRNRTLDAIGTAFPAPARQVAAEIPFDSSRKWSALAFDDTSRRGFYVFGAPDVLEPSIRSEMDVAAPLADLTASGLRVLLLAYHPDPGVYRTGDDPHVPANLTPLGLVSLSDEIQPAARETLDAFRQAGVRTVIISGDHPDTVAALARQAGFGADGELRTVSGLDLATMGDDELAHVAEETTIFGRITPEQKLRLVQALRSNDHYVAMIGDGVNDVLALKQANVGIAMQSGSQATRSVADLVLLDDSFAVLPKAFAEGQRIVRGSQDLIKLFLSRSLAMILIIIGAAVVSVAFPTTPRLNALPALLAVGIPTVALAAWAQPGRTTRHVLQAVLPFALTAALTIAPIGLTLYLSYIRVTNDVDLARTILTVVVTLCGLALIPFVEPPSPAWTGAEALSGDRRPALLALALAAVLAVILAVPPLRSFYELSTLAPLDLIVVAVVVAGWAFAFRAIWRHDLPRRVLRLSDDVGVG